MSDTVQWHWPSNGSTPWYCTWYYTMALWHYVWQCEWHHEWYEWHYIVNGIEQAHGIINGNISVVTSQHQRHMALQPWALAIATWALANMAPSCNMGISQHGPKLPLEDSSIARICHQSFARMASHRVVVSMASHSIDLGLCVLSDYSHKPAKMQVHVTNPVN